MLLICGVVPAFPFFYLFIYHSTRGGILSADIPPSPDVSHPEFCPPTSHLIRMFRIRNSIRRHPTFSGCLTSGILSATIPPSLDVSHPEFCPPTLPPSPDVSHPEFYPTTSHLLQMSHTQNSVQLTIQIPRIAWLVRHSRFAGSISARNLLLLLILIGMNVFFIIPE